MGSDCVNLAWTSSPVWLVINTLVAYRLTRLWIDDTVPPLPVWRHKLAMWIDRGYHQSTPENPTIERWSKKVATYGQMPLMYLVTCYWCVGFWVSVLVTLAASLIPSTVWPLIAVPFALSAVVGLIGTRD